MQLSTQVVESIYLIIGVDLLRVVFLQFLRGLDRFFASQLKMRFNIEVVH